MYKIFSLILSAFTLLLMSGCVLTAKDMLVGIGPDVDVKNKRQMRVLVNLPASIKDLEITEKGCCIHIARVREDPFAETDILYHNGVFIFTSFLDSVPSETPPGAQYSILKAQKSKSPVFEDQITASLAREVYLSPSRYEKPREFYNTKSNITYRLESNEDLCAFRSNRVPDIINPEKKNIKTCSWKGNPGVFRYNHQLSERNIDAIKKGLNKIFSQVDITYESILGNKDKPNKYDLFIKVEVPEEYKNKAFIAGGIGEWYRNIQSVFHVEYNLSFYNKKGKLVNKFVAHGRGANVGRGFPDAIEIILLMSVRDALNNLSNEIALATDEWARMNYK